MRETSPQSLTLSADLQQNLIAVQTALSEQANRMGLTKENAKEVAKQAAPGTVGGAIAGAVVSYVLTRHAPTVAQSSIDETIKNTVSHLNNEGGFDSKDLLDFPKDLKKPLFDLVETTPSTPTSSTTPTTANNSFPEPEVSSTSSTHDVQNLPTLDAAPAPTPEAATGPGYFEQAGTWCNETYHSTTTWACDTANDARSWTSEKASNFGNGCATFACLVTATIANGVANTLHGGADFTRWSSNHISNFTCDTGGFIADNLDFVGDVAAENPGITTTAVATTVVLTAFALHKARQHYQNQNKPSSQPAPESANDTEKDIVNEGAKAGRKTRNKK